MLTTSAAWRKKAFPSSAPLDHPLISHLRIVSSPSCHAMSSFEPASSPPSDVIQSPFIVLSHQTTSPIPSPEGDSPDVVEFEEDEIDEAPSSPPDSIPDRKKSKLTLLKEPPSEPSVSPVASPRNGDLPDAMPERIEEDVEEEGENEERERERTEKFELLQMKLEFPVELKPDNDRIHRLLTLRDSYRRFQDTIDAEFVKTVREEMRKELEASLELIRRTYEERENSIQKRHAREISELQEVVESLQQALSDQSETSNTVAQRVGELEVLLDEERKHSGEVLEGLQEELKRTKSQANGLKRSAMEAGQRSGRLSRNLSRRKRALNRAHAKIGREKRRREATAEHADEAQEIARRTDLRARSSRVQLRRVQQALSRNQKQMSALREKLAEARQAARMAKARADMSRNASRFYARNRRRKRMSKASASASASPSASPTKSPRQQQQHQISDHLLRLAQPRNRLGSSQPASSLGRKPPVPRLSARARAQDDSALGRVSRSARRRAYSFGSPGPDLDLGSELRFAFPPAWISPRRGSVRVFPVEDHDSFVLSNQ